MQTALAQRQRTREQAQALFSFSAIGCRSLIDVVAAYINMNCTQWNKDNKTPQSWDFFFF